MLVTSGPGATNAVTGLTDAMMDSVPIVCLTGQVPSHLIGTDAFQEADTSGITRPCTKHNYLCKSSASLQANVEEAFHVARSGRPGPVVIDLPKDVQLLDAPFVEGGVLSANKQRYQPRIKPAAEQVKKAVKLMKKAKRPIIYGGGGLVNSGPEASEKLRELVAQTGWPSTLTLMGLGVLSADDPHFLGMLGMHGTYEANMAMHQCDFMLNIGARFDDRVTGRLNAFSPSSVKVHADIDPSSIGKVVQVDVGIIGDAGAVLDALLGELKKESFAPNAKALSGWWKQINEWRARDCLKFVQSGQVIKPQNAVKRLYELSRERDIYITTEVGQHQMWAAQYFGFHQPNRWMTSGGLGTMGYGLPSAVGTQIAHPEATVIDISGEASFLMNMQELSTIAQYRLPVKVFILNNEWMGMVRQWQELNHGSRYSESYSASLPDFVKLAETFGMKGLRASNIDQLDDVITAMLDADGPVIADICIEKEENCFPMIPSGAAHNEMILSATDEASNPVSDEGKLLV
ncbi:MAG: acetolactate synthase [Alphaproteobacteria bacterium]|nr:MAG: acetolactate synthase [Alphaproteobacteria bacterium]